MKSEELLDAIGTVEDIYIKKAKEKQNSYKKRWIIIASAACFAVLVCLPVLLLSTMRMGSANPGEMAPPLENGLPRVEISYINGIVKEKITYDTDEYIEPLVEYITLTIDTKQGIEYPRTDTNDELDQDDIDIYLFDSAGNIVAAYLLNQNSLFDYQTFTVYKLTDEELSKLHKLLWMEKEEE